MRTISLVLVLTLLSLTPAYGKQICFPLNVGNKILQDLESLAACRTTVEAGIGALESCEAMSDLLEARIAEQQEEIEKGKKTIEETRKAGEQAAKVAAGPWYQKVLDNAKWIALGVLIGFVGGMSN